mmetsp:Transcript_69244/g.195200  ORF Transcript_69244/g.195200 Transcript_69244/m.195200 type:complete len:216 (-) Transcript_69244:3-650(-)
MHARSRGLQAKPRQEGFVASRRFSSTRRRQSPAQPRPVPACTPWGLTPWPSQRPTPTSPSGARRRPSRAARMALAHARGLTWHMKPRRSGPGDAPPAPLSLAKRAARTAGGLPQPEKCSRSSPPPAMVTESPRSAWPQGSPSSRRATLALLLPAATAAAAARLVAAHSPAGAPSSPSSSWEKLPAENASPSQRPAKATGGDASDGNGAATSRGAA